MRPIARSDVREPVAALVFCLPLARPAGIILKLMDRFQASLESILRIVGGAFAVLACATEHIEVTS